MDSNEFSPRCIQKAYGSISGPINVMFDITNKCNLNCKHCYNKSGNGCLYSDMSDQQMLDVANDLCRLRPRVVCLCGGEPLLRFELILKIIKLLTQHEITVNMVTNGMLITENKVDALVKTGISNIQISLDAYKKEIHDYFRGKDGAYNGAVEAIKLIMEREIIPDVSFIPTKLNWKELFNVVEFLSLNKLNRLGAMPLVPIGRGRQNSTELELSEDELFDFHIMLSKIKGRFYDFTVEYSDPLEHISLFLNNTEAKTSFFEVRSNGDVLLSSYLPIVFGNTVGNGLCYLWKHGLSRAWSYSRVREVASMITSLDDLKMLGVQPWNNEDIDIFNV